MVSHEDATSFSRIAQRIVDDYDGDDAESADAKRSERMRSTFIHKFVHSKDVELRTKQFMKTVRKLARAEKARSGDPPSTKDRDEHDYHVLNTRIFDAIDSDVSSSDSDGEERRIFRGTFELESSVDVEKRRVLFGRGRSISPKRGSGKTARNGSQSPVKDGEFKSSHAFASSKRYLAAQDSAEKSAAATANAYGSSFRAELLEPERIRWLYRNSSSKRWTPFCGYDSLRLECKYRELMQTRLTSTKSAAPVKSSNANGTLRNQVPSGSLSRQASTSEANESAKSPVNGQQKTASEPEEDDEPIIVRGGLYEVHVGSRTCSPIYWNCAEQCAVMRGTWFTASGGEPLMESLADTLETEHMNVLRSGLFVGRKAQSTDEGMFTFVRPLHQAVLRSYMVEWFSSEHVWLHEHSSLLGSMLPKLGMRQRGGTRLRRGYVEQCAVDDKPDEIGHLVFVIHGIGQKAYSGYIVKCCDRMRANAAKLVTEYYPALRSSARRVEFLPVEWRNALKLDGDTVASVTPPHMNSIRTMVNSTAMDILYYTSPMYRAELTAGLRYELQRLYTMFCARNPYFEQRGEVSVIAHSLGTIIFYDVLTGWNPVQLYKQQLKPTRSSSSSRLARQASSSSFTSRIEESETDTQSLSAEVLQQVAQREEFDSLMLELSEARRRVNVLEAKLLGIAENQHILAAQTDLEFHSDTADQNGNSTQSRSVVFPKNCLAGCQWKQLPKIANLFCLGSPLSVFLALRGVRPRGLRAQDEMFPPDLVRRVFNIYHPCDPVAYRLEPLLLKHYSTIQPLYIHPYNEAFRKPHYSNLPVVLMTPNSSVESPQVRSSTSAQNPQNLLIPSESQDDSNAENLRRSAMDKLAAQTDSRNNGFSTELRPLRASRNATERSLKNAASVRDFLVSSGLGNHSDSVQSQLTDSVNHNDLPQKSVDDTVLQHSSSRHVSLPPNTLRSRAMSSSTLLGSTTDSADYSNVDAAELEYRLDYEVRDSELSVYLAILRAHTSYWRDLDVMQFVLQHIFPQAAQSRYESNK